MLSAVKPEPAARPLHATVPETAALRATSDVAHEAAAIEPETGDPAPNVDLPGAQPASPVLRPPFGRSEP